MRSRLIFKTIRIVNWAQLRAHQERLVESRSTWIFRGERDARWRLETTLERTARLLDVPNSELPYREAGLIRRFKRQYHHHSVDPPASGNYLEWLAIMQHHGAPTRLLDWTYSFFPALYFAVANGDSEAALWAINHDRIIEALRAGKELARIEKLVDESRNVFDLRTFRHTFAQSPPLPFVCPVNPYRLNERLAIQQGLFLCPGDISQSFEQNLAAVVGDSPPPGVVTKLLISKAPAFRQEILRRLNRMNVNAATLFPGLDGFARSLTTLMALPKKNLPPDPEFLNLE
jgi:hypothetical protein